MSNQDTIKGIQSKRLGFYPWQSDGRHTMLIGKTWNMYKDGKTPEEIAIDIKQTIDDVKRCIKFCIKARENPSVIRPIEK